MTGDSRISLGRGVLAGAAVVLLASGAVGMWLVMRTPALSPAPPSPPVPSMPAPSSGGTRSEIVVPLTREAIERAGIVVTPVAGQGVAADLRLPGVVEPNSYRQVSVTPIVGGRIVRVSVRLGDRVTRGQSLARLYSPDIAEARSKYVAARAMLDAHERELARTQRLVEIGAASRQELERVHAEHAAQTADVESARARLQLLGATLETPAGSDRESAATTDIPAPIEGFITERLANDGLNVEPATKLFTIVDLSSVWVVANAYERDLPRVREGARATVSPQAFPGRSFDGHVSYIDPQLNDVTRTARIRVEVANPRGDLRLGMSADVVIAGSSGGPMLTIPKAAVQTVGGRQVVYVPTTTDPTKFLEREIEIGRAMGDQVEVRAGLTAGDSVVSNGSFFVRAEVERLGLRGPAGQAPVAPGQSAKILVGDSGYEPATVSLRAGVPARLTFVRTSEKTCGTEIVFPSLNIKRSLPLNEPVTIDFTPAKSESIAFTCGMNMLKGAIVVTAKGS